MTRHRMAASELRAIATGLRLTGRTVAADILDRTAAELLHHRLILVPNVARLPAYYLVSTDADDRWQSLSEYPTKAEATKAKAKMHRHWRNLRAKGHEV